MSNNCYLKYHIHAHLSAFKIVHAPKCIIIQVTFGLIFSGYKERLLLPTTEPTALSLFRGIR